MEISEVDFKKAIKAKIYVWARTAIFKSYIQKHHSLTKLIFQNKIKIKGGVLIFSRIIKKCFPNFFEAWKKHHPEFYRHQIKSEKIQENSLYDLEKKNYEKF